MGDRPKALDLFCGAGGAAVGLHRAGFDVVGVDINPQPRYPFEFHQADALTFDPKGYDLIWASPPCQMYSIMRNLPWLKDREYWDSIPPTREYLVASGLPYVIENVMGAITHGKIEGGWLCGEMFGMPFYRHRVFETNWFWLQPGHPKHRPKGESNPSKRPHIGATFTKGWQSFKQRRSQSDGLMNGTGEGKRYGESEDSRGLASWPGRREVPAGLSPRSNGVKGGIGHTAGWRVAAEAMGIDWMNRQELTQAIPPAYSEFIGRQLI